MNASEYLLEKAQSICDSFVNHCPGRSLYSSQEPSASVCAVVPLVWNGSRYDQVIQVLTLATFHHEKQKLEKHVKTIARDSLEEMQDILL